MIRYDGQVAVVTGSGGGLGRQYALSLATRGAKVIVNDLGGSLSGNTDTLQGVRPADLVVNEIRKLGGIAVANYDSVEHGEKIIAQAIKNFGKIDILINNAGILLDASFHNMESRDWDLVMLVHLKGAYNCTKAAWGYMQQQGYGRIVNTASASGLYGNFGQTNYSAAKLGLLGFTRSLAIEGKKSNIIVNCIAPLAGTRMTETVLPPDVVNALKPEYVAPLVCYLVSSECSDTGEVFEAGAGWIAKVRWQRNSGHRFLLPFTADDVKKDWVKVTDFTKVEYPSSLQDSLAMVTANISSEGGKKLSLEATEQFSATAGEKPFQTKSDKIFELISAYLQHNNGASGYPIVKKIQAVFQFEILMKKGGEPIAQWMINLKQKSGSVEAIRCDKPDATFTMTDEDFQAVCLGKLNPQIAFMQGKMKVKGNMRVATKFTPDLFPRIDAALLSMSVKNAVATYLKSQGASTENKSTPLAGATFSKEANLLKCIVHLGLIRDYLAPGKGETIVKKVGCSYRFDILPNEEGQLIPFTIDLKNGSGSLVEGAPSSCDAHFTMRDEDFLKVVSGEISPQIAFMQGKMKIKGNMRAAMKFTPDLFPKPSSL